MTEVLNVKKLRNRKLYSSATKSYISMGDIVDHVMKGGQVKIHDVGRKRDVTSEVVVMAFANYVKKHPETIGWREAHKLLVNLGKGALVGF